MRSFVLARAPSIRPTNVWVPDGGARGGKTHIARIRCPNLRCRALRIGIRRDDEPVDWAAHPCPRCRAKWAIVIEEWVAEVEVCAALKLFRVRRKFGPTGERLAGPWSYYPFDLPGKAG